MSSFAQQVARFNDNAERKTKETFRNSVQALAQESNALEKGEGGRMKLKTGFLRASQAVSLNDRPRGPTQGDPGTTYNTRIGQSPTEALARWNGDEAVYIGWTAEYAVFREFRDGFARGAAEKWPRIVETFAKLADSR